MQPDINVTLFKRAGEKIWQMQYRDPMDPLHKLRRSTGTSIKREAERLAGQWEKEIRAGHDTTGGRMLWTDFRAKYERNALAKNQVKESTADRIAIVFNSLESHVSFRRLCDLTTDKLTDYQTALREGGAAESTIKSYLAHVKSAMNWAVDHGHLPVAPKTRKPKRAKKAKRTTPMKGRPITGEEFDRLLAKTRAGLTINGRAKNGKPTKLEPSAECVASWEFYLRGLWLSGLRLAESLELHWTDCSRLGIDFSQHYPMLRIAADAEKGNEDRLLPMSPEFAEFLRSVPESQREGFVFSPAARHVGCLGKRLLPEHVSRTISRFGELANVKVAENVKAKPGREPVKVVKYASAHDLRRSFGERWATRVMPQVLQELMRHESIETTLRFYVGRNAQRTAAVLWEAHKSESAKAKPSVGADLGASGEFVGENVSFSSGGSRG